MTSEARLEALQNLVLGLKEEFRGMQGNVAADISELRGGVEELQGIITNLKILNKAVGDISEIKVFRAKLTKQPVHEELSHSEENEEGRAHTRVNTTKPRRK